MSNTKKDLFEHSGELWEGDPAKLRADFIYITQHWLKVTQHKEIGQEITDPLRYDVKETEETKQLKHKWASADEQHKRIEIGSEGWMPNVYFETVKTRTEELKELTVSRRRRNKRGGLSWINECLAISMRTNICDGGLE
ncbi:hypothetical protein K461DRAFT_278483 [Myriangium duriaei CBS 260.36]|uniref:Uncharacterized protein n=1 Tax=Myriangium duriaei CBS 260.36 TaxID=1168546 RepID=A0A9P4IYL2_9PEZI|nr:hypothetical protein K461DRAFT_278483 [Myriangium duriaei CBS 260.36]